MSEREQVEAFHEAMGITTRTAPEMPGEAERLLRCRLLLEECEEFIRASGCRITTDAGGFRRVVVDQSVRPDLAAMAHENADVRVITLGTDLTLGVDGRAFAEVMRANMTKRGPDGVVHRRADGKVIKPPGWTPADVARALGLKP